VTLLPVLRPFLFPLCLAAFVGSAMAQPSWFGRWGGLDLKDLIVPLIQVITFGMGTTLSPADFTRILKQPGPILIGFVLQFSAMPLVGYAIATGMAFEPEVAAGIVLIGSVSGGVASNLITYLAGGNVALSVTMTACSTLAAPFATPALMKLLAGRLVPIDASGMMVEICNMILVPIVTGLAAHEMLYGRRAIWKSGSTLATVTALAVGLAAASGSLPVPLALRKGLIIGFLLLGLVALTKWIVEIILKREGNWMDAALSFFSMLGICIIVAIITARSRDKLIEVGPKLLLAVILHNAIGFWLGYGGARLARLDERTARTVSIEVGMQNGGMASALAMGVMNSPAAALAAAIFGPYMNVSGALLATWWKRNPPKDLPPESSTPSR